MQTSSNIIRVIPSHAVQCYQLRLEYHAARLHSHSGCVLVLRNLRYSIIGALKRKVEMYDAFFFFLKLDCIVTGYTACESVLF